MFPLFVINIGLPIIYKRVNKSFEISQKTANYYLIKNSKVFSAVFIVCFVFLIFKFFISPMYQIGDGVYGAKFDFI